MDPLAGLDDSSSDDDAASQATEDDPQVPDQQAQIQPPPPPPPAPLPPPGPVPTAGTTKVRPRYTLRYTLRGHTSSISSVKFSPDGQLLASCGKLSFTADIGIVNSLLRLANDKLVKIWSPHTGELIRNLKGHTKGLSDVAWSSDSQYLASASDDTTIRIWDVDTVGFRALSQAAVANLTCHLGPANKNIERPFELRFLCQL
jgi:COMPASS component SWD3